QERTKIDWTNEIEKAKEENESRIIEMKLKADEAVKKMQTSTNHNQIKAPVVRLTSRLASHQSHSVRTPTVRFLNKTTGSSM
ncbi:unnamed protein product, partial [Rotaria sp. Silwood1]